MDNDNKILNTQDFEIFFDKLLYRIETISHFKKNLDVFLASDFNVFDFITPDENRLSDIISFLLNPESTHGQGNVFLIEFLNMLKSSMVKDQPRNIIDAIQKEIVQKDTIKIFREVSTDLIKLTQRRMDIVIDVGRLGIMIENKPFALDQNNQLGDYYDDLIKRFPDGSLLVYLSPSGSKPSSYSLSEDRRKALEKSGQLTCISYSKYLLEWLTSCIYVVKSEKIRLFLRDFYSYVAVNFTNNETEGEDSDV